LLRLAQEGIVRSAGNRLPDDSFDLVNRVYTKNYSDHLMFDNRSPDLQYRKLAFYDFQGEAFARTACPQLS
jgi:hypothetical protein